MLAPSIKSFDASFNKFSSVKSYNKFKPSLTTLRSFDLSSNLIHQDLHVFLTDAPANIQEIKLSNNKLWGSFPTTMKQLNSVRVLHVSSNTLKGFLPDFSSQFPNLRELVLSNNDFEGAITGGQINLPFLRKLDLSSNKLSSFDEMIILSNLIPLRELDISHNTLSSQIPGWLGKLYDTLKRLDLSHNQFTGLIPSEIGRMESTSTIRMAKNNFRYDIWFANNDFQLPC